MVTFEVEGADRHNLRSANPPLVHVVLTCILSENAIIGVSKAGNASNTDV